MAARYRKIDPRIWSDEKFRQLTPAQQRIALYVLTAQSNRIGLFSFSPGKAGEDLRLSSNTFRKGFERVCHTFGWQWDQVARILYIPTWWKYNPPENANNVIGNLKDLDDLPQNRFLTDFMTNIQYLPQTLHETFKQTLVERYPQRLMKRSPTQEQEQEQEQEIPPIPQGETLADSNGGNGQSRTAPKPEDLVRAWNSIPGVKPVQNLISGKGVHHRILVRVKEQPDHAWWERLFETVKASDWLCGRKNGRSGPFHVTLEWALGPENLAKILQGDYANSYTRRVNKVAIE